MLEVLCGEDELAEYGEVVTVGDVVRRMGARRHERSFGTGLDDVEYRLDRYAEVAGGPPLVIEGEVDAIAAVYARLTRADGAWSPSPGSAWLEPLRSTRDTRRSTRRLVPTDADDWYRIDHRDGDESLFGWRFTLADATVGPWEGTS